MQPVTVVGGGLAGCEAAYHLAARGIAVVLVEMKPHKRTPAQTGDGLAELVCSNSLRGAALGNAVGLLKEELRRMGSIVLRSADRTAVPAGGALAVDRERFSAEMTAAIASHPLIEVVHREVTAIGPERPLVLATGPLTSDALAEDFARVVGSEHLAYYDAVAPIVSAESIDASKVWKQSRWGKGSVVPSADAHHDDALDAAIGGDEAYVNCPLDAAEYAAFVEALVRADKVEARAFEQTRYFEGCLPCEIMAERGPQTLAFGPMKPVGLTDPRTGRRPHAVVQLRQEDAAATAYNLVGFQTRMKYADQDRVFRMIPGLEQAEFLRYGSVHRNTFIDAPELLSDTLELRALSGVYVAGQLAGVEGYVESAASGLLCALMLAQKIHAEPISRPPATTALGGLLTHLSRKQPSYQPSNINWSLIPPLEGSGRRLKKRERYEAMAQRALRDLDGWRAGLSPASPEVDLAATRR